MNAQNRSPLPQLSKNNPVAVVRAIAGIVAATLFALLMHSSQPALARASSSYGLLKTYPDPSPAINEEFGSAVAWLPAGDKLIVGARGDQLGGATPLGAAYVLSATTGATLRVFTETASVSNDWFGQSIAVSGTRALIGAPLDAFTPGGSAFLYDTSTGALVQAFHNPIPATDDEFGSSVAILSDTAVLVGESQYLNTGRAYVCLIADGTCPTATAIDSPSGASGGNFGFSVAALGDKFAVAAPFDGSPGTVYVFTTSTGALYQTSSLTSTSGNFGWALSVVSDTLLIGAPNYGTGIHTPGVAFQYKPDGTLLKTFLNPIADDAARFGAAVAGDGNLVLIGAPGASGNEGRAYVFDATTGALLATLQKAVPAAGDQFGFAVAMLGEDFLVGALDDSQFASKAGAVYRFGVQVQFNLFLPLIRR